MQKPELQPEFSALETLPREVFFWGSSLPAGAYSTLTSLLDCTILVSSPGRREAPRRSGWGAQRGHQLLHYLWECTACQLPCSCPLVPMPPAPCSTGDLWWPKWEVHLQYTGESTGGREIRGVREARWIFTKPYPLCLDGQLPNRWKCK